MRSAYVEFSFVTVDLIIALRRDVLARILKGINALTQLIATTTTAFKLKITTEKWKLFRSIP